MILLDFGCKGIQLYFYSSVSKRIHFWQRKLACVEERSRHANLRRKMTHNSLTCMITKSRIKRREEFIHALYNDNAVVVLKILKDADSIPSGIAKKIG